MLKKQKTNNNIGVIASKRTILTRLSECWTLYLFLLPGLLVTIIFKLVPMYGIQIAFKDFIPGRPMSEAPWVGFEHFVRFFTTPDSLQIIWSTVKLAFVMNILTFPLSIIFALMLNEVRHEKRKKFVQNITYLPHLFSVVVVMSVTSILLAPNTGLVNLLIKKFGGEQILFYGHDKYVIPIYVITGIWQGLGSGAIMYLSALSTIDQEQLEAAKIDGANRMRIIWNIELPALSDTIVIMLILQCANLFTVGTDKMLLLQTSLNLGASEIISTYVYKIGLINGDFAFSTAISLFNTLVNVTCLLIVNGIAKKVSGNSVF